MKIKIEELEVGDEVLLINSQNPKYLKVLETPRKSKKLNWDKSERFIAVRCQINVTTTSHLANKWDYKTKSSVPFVYTVNKYNLEPPLEDSPIEKVNLNSRTLWLVKKNNN